MKKVFYLLGMLVMLSCETQNLDSLQEQIDDLKEQVDKNTTDLASLQTMFSNVTSKIDELASKQEKTDADVSALVAAQDALKTFCDNLVDRIDFLGEQSDANSSEIEELKKFMDDAKIIYAPVSIDKIESSNAEIVIGDIVIENADQCQQLSKVKQIVGNLKLGQSFKGDFSLENVQGIWYVTNNIEKSKDQSIVNINMPKLQILYGWRVHIENTLNTVYMPSLIKSIAEYNDEDAALAFEVKNKADLSSFIEGNLQLHAKDVTTKILINEDLTRVKLSLFDVNLNDALIDGGFVKTLDIDGCLIDEPLTINVEKKFNMTDCDASKLTVKSSSLSTRLIISNPDFRMCNFDVDELRLIDLYISSNEDNDRIDEVIDVDLSDLDNLDKLDDIYLRIYRPNVSVTGLNGTYDNIGDFNCNISNHVNYDKIGADINVHVNVLNGVQHLSMQENTYGVTETSIYAQGNVDWTIFGSLLSSQLRLSFKCYDCTEPLDLCCMKNYLLNDETTAPIEVIYNQQWQTREQLLSNCE